MKNKLVFRILGALASSLIIVSVFVPFISVTGYTTSLWESFETTNSLYLPIMIIVFGAIGVIFFALNIKTEFAYMSTGAILFFAVMRTIDILNQGTFNTLSVGYYCLVIGAILTGVMAFLTNLKGKEKLKQEVPVTPVLETTVLDQIDKLYNDQISNSVEISPIQPVENIVNSIPVQPMEKIQPVTPSQLPVEQNQKVDETIVAVKTVQQPVNPVVNEFANQPVNPVVNEFSNQPVNPVVNEFANQPVNPVVQNFSNPQINSQPIITEQPLNVSQSTPIENVDEPLKVNPVVNSFTNSGSTELQNQSSGLDIFGQ